MSYSCACCGELHEGLPDLGISKPDLAAQIPKAEWPGRVELTADTCVVDGQYFFIRGVLLIPVHGHAQGLGFGVWVSQQQANFQSYVDHPDSAGIGPYFGWFSNELAPYAPTLHLKARAHFQGGQQRPLIELERTEHPLAVDFYQGISLERAWEIVHTYL